MQIWNFQTTFMSWGFFILRLIYNTLSSHSFTTSSLIFTASAILSAGKPIPAREIAVSLAFLSFPSSIPLFFLKVQNIPSSPSPKLVPDPCYTQVCSFPDFNCLVVFQHSAIDLSSVCGIQILNVVMPIFLVNTKMQAADGFTV